ncbi:hypothetical protein OJ996_09185 [Luteolibacter sp. GHJ8]|uniref:Uncharacterized protein n=1 Tax=Luteolibacter rhizosphaerae TaxID=2989719 RepID=A0ABT3G1N3_9BACT|nr:hypothetical protein [Luteolibacter rhizosphaerae]MCW1913747.1 hypothetical protein [Luteolibacter rhizosphaerae]
MHDDIDLFQFTEMFPTEQSCIDFLEAARFRGGSVQSPFTGGECYRVTTRPGTFKCKETRQTFSVRHGTIFEDSRLKLRKWFFAIFLIHSMRGDITSVQIAKAIGVTQKTAWFMIQRVRSAVEHRSFSLPTAVGCRQAKTRSKR